MPLPDHLIVSTDFDGTLTAPSQPDILAPDFMRWLEGARSRTRVSWVINTGRCWPTLSAELERRGAALWPDWVVLVEREIHRVRDRNLFPLAAWNERCTSAHARLFASCAEIWEELREALRSFERLQMVEDIGSPLGLIAHSEDQADQVEPLVLEKISRVPGLVSVRNSIYFRFGHSGFTKGSCLREIAAAESLDPASCFAAGDHYNDLSMLARANAHFLCCPANSTERVKRQVLSEGGYVAAGFCNEGVVEGLRRFFG